MSIYCSLGGLCPCFCLSVAKSCLTLCDSMDCSTSGFPVHYQLPEFAQTHVHWVSDAIQPCHPLSSLLLLPSIFPSIRIFSNELVLCIKWHQFFQCIFRVDFPWDWLVWSPCCPSDSQESSLAPQFKGINSLVFSLLCGPVLTSVHDYWKSHSLSIQTFVGKVISLLFNMLSRFVIIFLPGNKFLLILWLQSLSAVISEPRKIKSVTVSTFSPSICHEVKELDDSLS